MWCERFGGRVLRCNAAKLGVGRVCGGVGYGLVDEVGSFVKGESVVRRSLVVILGGFRVGERLSCRR